MWHGNSELSPFDSEVLTHVLDAHYESPPGFDWEKNPDPSEDPAPPVTNTNVQAMSDAYVQAALERSMHYQGKSVLVPFGQDFRFQNASLQFDNMDAIVSFVNRNKKRYIDGQGVMSLSITKVDPETGEFAGVFSAIQPSDSDMGGREVVDVKITGELYGQLEEA